MKFYEMNNKREWYREEYLKSEHWKRLRTKKLAMHGSGRCEACDGTGPFEVHHVNYRNIVNVNVQFDLLVLCLRCHRVVHWAQIEKERNMNKIQFNGWQLLLVWINGIGGCTLGFRLELPFSIRMGLLMAVAVVTTFVLGVWNIRREANRMRKWPLPLLVLVLLCAGCYQQNSLDARFEVRVYDGCEYIVVARQSAPNVPGVITSVIHKGNCTNAVHNQRL